MMLTSPIFVTVLLFCVSSSRSDMSRFSTKAPYVFKSIATQNYSNFVPRKVWTILRHGTRLPSKKVISRYIGLAELRDELLAKSKSLSDEQRAAFQRWKPMEMKMEHQKFLTKQGEHEHLQLGLRFRQRFPSLLVGEPTFTFKHTPTQRTQISAEKFIEGLFEAEAERPQSVVVERDDPILRPYKGCELWRRTVKKNKEMSLKEQRKFESSEHVANLINEFRESTAIEHLTSRDLELIYTICGFESAWRYELFNGQSVWCSLFRNQQQLKVLEYLEDLEYYWIDSYGFDITRHVACRTVQDIYHQLDPSIDGKSLTFYFTHSGTILKLLTFLGLYKDEFDLTAENFRDERLWKTSNIDTFSSNLNVILFDSKLHGPHIQVQHQEQVIELPACRSNQFGMCPFEDFRAAFEAKLKSCDLNELCRLKDEL